MNDATSTAPRAADEIASPDRAARGANIGFAACVSPAHPCTALAARAAFAEIVSHALEAGAASSSAKTSPFEQLIEEATTRKNGGRYQW